VPDTRIAPIGPEGPLSVFCITQAGKRAEALEPAQAQSESPLRLQVRGKIQRQGFVLQACEGPKHSLVVAGPQSLNLINWGQIWYDSRLFGQVEVLVGIELLPHEAKQKVVRRFC
jgi:hypothetical protein